MLRHLKLLNSILVLLLGSFITTNCFLLKESLDDQLKKYNIYSKSDLKKEKNIPYLIEALNDENPYVISTAITALGDLKQEDAITLIIDKLGDKSLAIRINSILALENIGIASDDVMEALNLRKSFESNERVRKYIYNALSELNKNKSSSEKHFDSSQKEIVSPTTENKKNIEESKIPKKKISIALLDLETVGVPQEEAKVLTDRLRTELFLSNKFVVLEREKMKDILQEQGFQLSGCTSNECAVEAGKLIGVKKMLAGSIGKIGNVITISARIIDVQSGKIDNVAYDDCECPIENVLTRRISILVQKLIN